MYIKRVIKNQEGREVSGILICIDTGLEFRGSILTNKIFEYSDQLNRIPKLSVHLGHAYIKPLDSALPYWPPHVTLKVKKQIEQQICQVTIESKGTRGEGIPIPSFRSTVRLTLNEL